MKRHLLVGLSMCLIGCAQPSNPTPTAENTQTPTPTDQPTATPEIIENTLRDQLVGTYECVDSDTPITINITEVAGVILVEEYLSDEQTYSLQDIYPNDANQINTSAEYLDGISYLYNYGAIEQLDVQFDAGGDKLTITSFNRVISELTSHQYAEREDMSLFDHRSTEFGIDVIYPEEMIGKWGINQNLYSTYLEMNEDGTMIYLSKEKDLPIRVFEGRWGYDPNNELLLWIGTYLGEEVNGYEQILMTARVTESDIFLQDVQYSGLLIENGEMYMESVSDDFRVHENIYVRDDVYSVIYAKGSYTIDNYGYIEEIEYFYRVPQISDKYAGYYPIGKAIDYDHGVKAWADIEHIRAGEVVEYYIIDYITSEIQDLMTIVVSECRYPFSDMYYKAYYLDLRDGEMIYLQDVLVSILKVDPDQFIEAVRTAAKEWYIENNAQFEQDSFYWMTYDRIDGYITIDTIAVLPQGDNDYIVYTPIASMAQNGVYNEELYIHFE